MFYPKHQGAVPKAASCSCPLFNYIANACHLLFLSFKKQTPAVGPTSILPRLDEVRAPPCPARPLPFSNPSHSQIVRCLADGLLSRNRHPPLLRKLGEQEPNTHVQLESQLIEGLLSLCIRSFDGRRIGQTPMNRRRVWPGGASLANPITERDHAIK